MTTTDSKTVTAFDIQEATAVHRCSNCFVAQYGIKSNIPCKNEWWSLWDATYGVRKTA